MPFRPEILVGESSSLMQEVMERALEGAGFRVHCVGDGKTLLDRLEAGRPDLLILDLVLPSVDGIEVLRRIRRAPELRGLPVIAVSALHRPDHVAATRALGVAAHIRKPFSPAALVQEIERLEFRKGPP